MSSNAVHAVQGLSWANRAKSVAETATRLRTIRDQLKQQRESKAQEVLELKARADRLIKVGELFRKLMDLLVDSQVKLVESVVTKGLQSIFHDQDLRFEAKLSSKYNRTFIEFSLSRGDPENGGHRGSPLESFGGGPTSFAGLVIRILTMIRLKRRPLLLLDETLSAVSDEYVEATGQFLHRLATAEKSPIDLLLVTHKHAFLEHADTSYQCSEVVGSDGTSWITAKRLRKG